MVSLLSNSIQTLATSGGAVTTGRGTEGPEKEAIAPDELPLQLEALLASPLVQRLLQKQAELAAQATALQRPRADLIPGVCIVAERELPNCTPWSLESIRARRKSGLLPAIKDATKPKGKDDYLYNLYDVWAIINGQKCGQRQTVRHIPADLTVKPLTTSQRP